MPKHFLTRGHGRALSRHHRIAAAGVAALGAAAIGLSAVPSDASTATTSEAAVPVAQVAYSTERIKGVEAGVTDRLTGAGLKAEQIEAKQRAEAEAAAERKADAAAARERAEQAREAEQTRAAERAASRAAERAVVKRAAAPKAYGDNLDGWIRESLDIMRKHGIPGSYEGIHRNIMRESSGNPKAINLWDVNARNGIPSKGLLQVIPPTFDAYHVPGTPKDIYDPVANITAACNYAADRYGTMDNVDSAY